jgi:hypothetical protein
LEHRLNRVSGQTPALDQVEHLDQRDAGHPDSMLPVIGPGQYPARGRG